MNIDSKILYVPDVGVAVIRVQSPAPLYIDALRFLKFARVPRDHFHAEAAAALPIIRSNLMLIQEPVHLRNRATVEVLAAHLLHIGCTLNHVRGLIRDDHLLTALALDEVVCTRLRVDRRTMVGIEPPITLIVVRPTRSIIRTHRAIN